MFNVLNINSFIFYYYVSSNKVVTKITLSAILTWREGFQRN